MTPDPTLEFDVLSPEFLRDPYPLLRRMRAEAPVYRHALLNAFILTRHDHIEALTRDARFSSQRVRMLMGPLFLGADGQRRYEQWSRAMLFLDPPQHTRIRSYVARATTPQSVEPLRPVVQAVVQRALDRVRSRREADLVSEFAEPVTLGVISEVFAIPEADRPRFLRWTEDMLKPAGTGLSTSAIMEQVKSSSDALFSYMLALCDERRQKPEGADLISRLLASATGDDGLLEDVSYQCISLIAAGQVTVMNQISNAVLALLNHPAELRRLREDPGLLEGAIEEAMRYDPPVLALSRLCAEDAEIGGVRIPKGDLVFGMIAAANRDPAVFPDPDRFDITRNASRHLAFGSGPHSCIGAALTRIELEEALRALLTLPRWELGDRPSEYRTANLQDRGPSLLPVRFSVT